MGGWLDLILEVFSNLNDSVILFCGASSTEPARGVTTVPGSRQGSGHSLTTAAAEEQLCESCFCSTFCHSPRPSRCRRETRQVSRQPDPRPAPRLSTTSPHICPWQLHVLPPSDANPISPFSCLIPRQHVAPSLCSQLSFGYLISTASNKLVIFLKGDIL